MEIRRQRVGIGLRLVVVVHARQVPPALVSPHLDESCAELSRGFDTRDVSKWKTRDHGEASHSYRVSNPSPITHHPSLTLAAPNTPR